MSALLEAEVSRRAFLSGGGALILGFTMFPLLAQQPQEGRNVGKQPKKAPKLPGSLGNNPMLDSWIRIDADGSVTVITGKVELGQGIKTALLQIAAEELVVDPQRMKIVTADTGGTPNEAYTAGSQSMSDSGTALLHAAAQVREILVGLAAQRFSVPAESLSVKDGVVHTKDGRNVRYGELVSGEVLKVRAQPESRLRDPATHTVMGKSLRRVDIPAKVTGMPIYVQDLRLPGMVHARVVRPPSYRARLKAVETAKAQKMPGVLKIVRNGSYLAVIAEREWQAITAMRALAQAASWEERPELPQKDPYAELQRPTAQRRVIRDAPPLSGLGVLEATYRRPYQMHAAIGPSCAVGLAKDDLVTVWTHSQGVYPLRNAIAEMLRVPNERVRCIHMEGSGCYGHNGADDAGADAALLAVAFPGRPVRVQWMREDENRWEPYGSAMVVNAKARLDGSGNVAGWQYAVWSHPHSTRPGRAGNLAPAWHLDTPFELPTPNPIPQPAGGGDRNAIPLYKFPNVQVIHHYVTEMPLRVSALRALGGYHNVFAIESFMDELARTAKADPVEFRLRQMEDQRARDVIRLAAERFGWSAYQRQPGRGRGFAFARYKNLAAYCAVACEVEVERLTGRVRMLRAVACVDSGESVNPDGLSNQIQGGIMQSMSWTLFESVDFNDTRITSRDWASYPIVRFSSLPDSVEVHIINRPGQPFLGTGEAAQGPAGAALANAVADATGVRIRDLPLTPARVNAALGP
ncbi:MAG: aldehyde dehydrogenase [Betaproteobacteria bacterium RIFCSPLOWO2_12_FULL_62_13b]|nr:MAG: aldehyde dehydrogenase [Betaproteobacteria bacterium RIFCSPLOWO2_12_FULL_62_13b]